ncbi:hypothetical protein [Sphingobium baderi]|uniref:hypothetical protein n=1 Tax=Sphingobium baderi TaxID=1332080 RepID=UPI002B40D000|nr:hypothetical protein [Sphingobium baderi]WRD75837.1 hypothetical protein QQ987_13730 [Sphingobium baderi]
MKTIDLFYQGEGVAEIEYLEIEPDTTFADLKARLIDKHGIAADALLFAEDEDDPLDDAQAVKDRPGGKGLKLHLHSCRHIMVAVTYNGEAIDRKFAPGATIARVKRWAAERKFGMTEEEAGEHVLQIAGTHERPAPGTHIGVLANRKTCGLAFDLVPDERVNGARDDRR